MVVVPVVPFVPMLMVFVAAVLIPEPISIVCAPVDRPMVIEPVEAVPPNVKAPEVCAPITANEPVVCPAAMLIAPVVMVGNKRPMEPALPASNVAVPPDPVPILITWVAEVAAPPNVNVDADVAPVAMLTVRAVVPVIPNAIVVAAPNAFAVVKAVLNKVNVPVAVDATVGLAPFMFSVVALPNVTVALFIDVVPVAAPSETVVALLAVTVVLLIAVVPVAAPSERVVAAAPTVKLVGVENTVAVAAELLTLPVATKLPESSIVAVESCISFPVVPSKRTTALSVDDAGPSTFPDATSTKSKPSHTTSACCPARTVTPVVGPTPRITIDWVLDVLLITT